MKLLVVELVSHLEQEVTPKKTTDVEAVRIHLYKHKCNIKLQVQILDEYKNLIAESTEVDTSLLNEADYYHGQVTFNIIKQLKAEASYYIRLKPEAGYSFSESSYIGWCLDFDFNTYEKQYSGSDSQPLFSAFDYEIWSLK